MKVDTKIPSILHKGKTEAHKWAQNGWIERSDTLIPLPYFFMKWGPEKRTRRKKMLHTENKDSEQYWQSRKKANSPPRKRKRKHKENKWEKNPISLYISAQRIDAIKENKNTRYNHTANKTNTNFLKKIMTHTTIHKIRQEIHPEEKSETNRKKKQKYTHAGYCLGVSHFF